MLATQDAGDAEVIRYRILQMEKQASARINLLRTDFIAFVKQVFKTLNPDTEYVHNWHIDCIAEYLRALERGEMYRFICNIPPREMKTITITIAWTAWLIGHNPHLKFMLATYSSALASRNMVDLKKILGSAWFRSCFPDFQISESQDTKKKILTTKGGHVISGAAGSKDFTGEGATHIIIDDPTDPEMAMSDADRERVNRWFTGTMTSRLNDKRTGIIVIVMQRLHEDDLSGHLMAKGWKAAHLCLQAKAEYEQVINIGTFRKTMRIGEYLDPVRLSQEILDGLQEVMTAYAYSGQFQQNPAPDEGGILPKQHWIKWQKEDPPTCFQVFQTMDTAFGKDEEADESVILTWGLFNGTGKDGKDRVCCILLDAVSGSWPFSEMKDEAIKAFKFHRPDRVIIEDKASGQSLIQELRRMRYPAKPFKVIKDKVFRAHEASQVLEKGHVYYMPRDWATDVIKQCAAFPKGARDDKVDCTTMAWLYIRRRFWLQLTEDEALVDKMSEAGYKRKSKRVYYGGR
jgi:predicted phage terminase large subunit-like protein